MVAGVHSLNVLFHLEFLGAVGRTDTSAARVSESVAEASRFKPRRSSAVSWRGILRELQGHGASWVVVAGDSWPHRSSDSDPAPPAKRLPAGGISVGVGNWLIDSLAEGIAGLEVRGVTGGQRERHSGPRVARRAHGSVTQ